MSFEFITSKRSKRIGVAAIMLTFVSASIALMAHSDDSKKKPKRVPLPVHQAVRGTQCVEPTDEMRKNHMEKILHHRDRTTHEGIRTAKYSLKNCINCHADPQTKSVLGKDGFCISCHTYAAVTMDCFGCHTGKAEDGKEPILGNSRDLIDGQLEELIKLNKDTTRK
jgi:hypothetical protein